MITIEVGYLVIIKRSMGRYHTWKSVQYFFTACRTKRSENFRFSEEVFDECLNVCAVFIIGDGLVKLSFLI